MSFAICTVSIMPLRISNSDKSEMVSQVLFGEILEVLETKSNWAKIKVSQDNYIGWVDTKQFTLIEDSEYQNISSIYYSTDLVQIIVSEKTKQLMPLVMGSHLPNLEQNKITIAGKTYLFEGETVASNVIPIRKNIIENALSYINAPYLWGGKNPFGIDCSGLSQMAYKLSGIKIPRDASEQANFGETINFITDATFGDLAFFDNNEGSIIHVGILLGENKIIHSSGKVRIENIDHQGIFNLEMNKYTHNLRIIKSYLK